MDWYSKDNKKLSDMVGGFLGKKRNMIVGGNINGIVVPHGVYDYSGPISGKAYSLLMDKKFERAVVIGPSHYDYLEGVACHSEDYWETPLGSIKIFNKGFEERDLKKEHSIDNQIPFLQKIGIKEIMPLMVGDINVENAREIASKLARLKDVIFIFSTDLSHFLSYSNATMTDEESMGIILNLDFNRIKELDSCGVNALMIFMWMCKLNSWKPKIIEYKNSGDVGGDKKKVVGYASFWF